MRYKLQPYTGPASRYHCPQCRHRSKTFSRYIDTQNHNQQLADHVGRCSRENNCGYHFKPADYFKTNGISGAQPNPVFVKPPPPKPTLYMCNAIVNQSLAGYQHNCLYQYFVMLLGDAVAANLFKLYRVGSSRHWAGATVFWQTDVHLRTRTGKVMLYQAHNGKRVKQPFNHITWAHKLLDDSSWIIHDSKGKKQHEPKYTLKQCLFGEHLLAHTPMQQPVAIVESEKTALLASVFMPHLLWLATGGLHNLNYQCCKVLKGRTLILYPDLNAADKWQTKADTLKWQLPGTTIKVSRLLENCATPTEHQNGLDIGDVLVREAIDH